MKTLLKIVLAIGGLLALLLVVAIVIVPAVVDPNDYKGTIAEKVKEQTGRALKLDGDIKLSVFPWLGLELGSASLSNAEGFEPAEMVRIGSAQAKVKVMPLITSFGKRIEMDTVIVDGLEVHLAKNAAGASNWDDLVKAGEEAPSAPAGDDGAPPIAALALGGVDVRNAVVTWKDDASGQDVRIDGFNLQTGAVSLDAPIDVNVELDVTGVQPPIAGHVTAVTPIALDLKNQRYEATNLTLEAGLTGDALPGGKANVALGGAFAFDGANQTLALAGLDIEASELSVAGGAGNVKVSGDIKGDLASQRFTVSGLSVNSNVEGGSFPDGLDVELSAGDIVAALQEQTLNGSELKLRVPALRLPGLAGNLGATATLDGKLDGNVFALEDFAATGQLTGDALAGGAVNFDLGSELVANLGPGVFEANRLHLEGRVTGDAVPGGEQPIEMLANVVMSQGDDSLMVKDLELMAGELSAAGNLSATGLSTGPALNGKLSVPAFNLRALAQTFGQSLPAMADETALTAVGLDVTIESSGSGANLNPLNVTLDDTTLTGNVDVSSFEPLAVQFELHADNLDADRYMAPASEGETRAAATPASAAGAAGGLPIEQLRALDVNGLLTVASLTASNVTLSDIEVGLEAKNGLLKMSPLGANLYGGSYAGSAALDATGDQAVLTLDERISGIQASALLADLGIEPGGMNLNGASSIALKAQATGDPAAQTYAVSGLSLTADLAGEGLPGGRLAFSAGGDLSADLQAETLAARDFKLNFADLAATANLEVTQLKTAANFSGNIDVPAFDAKSLVKAFAAPGFATSDPSALSSVSLSTTVKGSKSALRLEPLTVKLDESTLNGRFAVEDFATQALRFDLALDSIDADRYLAPATGAKQPAATPGAAAAIIPVDTIRKLDVDGQFRIGSLKMSNASLSNIELTAKGKDGRLALHPLKANLYQGSYSGNINIDASGDQPDVSLDETFSGVQAGPLLKDLRGDDLIAGTANITTKLNASGEYADAIKKSLDGTIQFSFLDGSIKGIDVFNLICGGLSGLGVVPGEATQGEARTRFAELTGTATITDGVVQNPDLQAKSPLLRVNGNGSANLVQESVDYVINAGLVASCEGQGGAAIGDLSGVSIPVRITGPFTNLSYAPEFGDLLETAAGAKVKEQVEKAQEKVEEEVTEKLQEKVGEQLGDKLGKEAGGAAGEAAKGLIKGLFGN